MGASHRALLVVAIALACALLQAPPLALAAEEASWSGSEQPIVPGGGWPVGLGNVGDIEFYSPARGVLITEGHAPSIPPGLWAYDGHEWHEYATVCGASENGPDNGGRIAWSSPEEFWTVSDGRKGQANESVGTSFEREPPLEDNTLCHFADGQVVGSYAHPAFQASSYQPMHGAACLSPSDCWFGGGALEEPQIGSFHLQWNGSALEEQPYVGEGHAVQDMLALEGSIYESVLLSRFDRSSGTALPALHRIEPTASPTFQPEEGIFEELPLALYSPSELPTALDFLHLSGADGALWAAAGSNPSEPVEPPHAPGQVTLVRAVKRSWSQLIGPEHPLEAVLASKAEEEALLGQGVPAQAARVSAIAAEPGTGDAWLALSPPTGAEKVSSATARALVVHVSSVGAVLGADALPSAQEESEGTGPKGSAAKLTCPAAQDCWLATTQGWLFHLATPPLRQRSAEAGEGEFFHGLITYRPPDQGLPQVTPDAPPEDDSGLHEEVPETTVFPETKALEEEARVTVPLVSKVSSRLVHGTMLQLRFHLAVKARVRLLAKRHGTVVASTKTYTLRAGERTLLLRLDPRRWPTKLSLQTHALAPLPTIGSRNSNVGSISTGFVELPRTALLDGPLP